MISASWEQWESCLTQLTVLSVSRPWCKKEEPKQSLAHSWIEDMKWESEETKLTEVCKVSERRLQHRERIPRTCKRSPRVFINGQLRHERKCPWKNKEPHKNMREQSSTVTKGQGQWLPPQGEQWALEAVLLWSSLASLHGKTQQHLTFSSELTTLQNKVPHLQEYKSVTIPKIPIFLSKIFHTCKEEQNTNNNEEENQSKLIKDQQRH